VADHTIKVTTVPLALVVYLILGEVYSPLRSAVVRQLFVDELLTSVVYNTNNMILRNIRGRDIIII
jgi:hypothetical protein